MPERSDATSATAPAAPSGAPAASAADIQGQGVALRRAVQGGIFWTATGLVLASALVIGANRPLWWLALAAAAGGLFLAQVALDAMGRDALRLWRRVGLAGVLYLLAVGWAMVQAGPAPVADWAHPAWSAAGFSPGSVSATPGATWQGALRLLAYAALFWIAARGGAEEGRARRFVAVVAAFSVALGLYGLVALYAGVNPITGEPAYPGVVTASFINRNAYAFYAGLGLMACVADLALRIPPDRKSPSLRRSLRAFAEALGAGAWLPFMGILVLTVALVQTESRAGTAASLAGAMLLAAVVLGPRRRVVRRAGWGLMALGVVVAILTGQRLGTRLEANPAEDQRADLFAHVLEGIGASPWLGHGLGAFPDAFRTYMTSDFSRADWQQAHSSFLENAFELGLPAAAALYLSLALVTLVLIRGMFRRQRLRPVPAFALASVIAAGLHASVDFSLQMPATAALFAMILGVGVACGDRQGGAEAEGTRNA